MLRYTPEEWRDTPDLWQRIIHPDDYERIWAANLAHEGVGTVFDEEYRVITKDGRTLWIRDVAVLVADETGEEAFAHGFIFDVTERHLAEDQLRETEAKYRAIVKHVPAAIYVDRPDDTMTTLYVSPEIQEILGVTPEAFLAEPDLWLQLIDPDSRAEVRASYLAAVDEQRSWAGEYLVHTPDGRDVWVHDVGTGAYERVRQVAPEIEWRKVVGIRNILAHGYFGISLPIIWDVVQNKLDVFSDACLHLLNKAADKDFG